MLTTRSVRTLHFLKQSTYINKRRISDQPYEEYVPVDLYSSVVNTLPTSDKKPQTLILYNLR
jgi:hypothetical protein